MENRNRAGHMPVVMDIVEHGLNGDTEKVRAYAELLLERLEKENSMHTRYLKKILAGESGKGKMYYPCEQLTDKQKGHIQLFLAGKCSDGYLMTKLGIVEWKDAEKMVAQYRKECKDEREEN